MTREDYIKCRKQNLLGEVAYDYFKERATKVFNRNLFFYAIKNYHVQNPNINWNLLWNIYDVKFNITTLHEFDSSKPDNLGTILAVY